MSQYIADTWFLMKEVELPPEVVVLKAQAVRFEATGSRVICDPPPLTTDADYLVLLKNGTHVKEVSKALECGSWIGAGSMSDALIASEDITEEERNTLDIGPQFQSLKKGRINLILTCDQTFYERFMAATSVAKMLNLQIKAERVALFRAVLYGERVSY